jgi:hypothetical protein
MSLPGGPNFLQGPGAFGGAQAASPGGTGPSQNQPQPPLNPINPTWMQHFQNAFNPVAMRPAHLPEDKLPEPTQVGQSPGGHETLQPFPTDVFQRYSQKAQAPKNDPGFSAWSPGKEMIQSSSRLQTASPAPKVSQQNS